MADGTHRSRDRGVQREGTRRTSQMAQCRHDFECSAAVRALGRSGTPMSAGERQRSAAHARCCVPDLGFGPLQSGDSKAREPSLLQVAQLQSCALTPMGARETLGLSDASVPLSVNGYFSVSVLFGQRGIGRCRLARHFVP